MGRGRRLVVRHSARPSVLDNYVDYIVPSYAGDKVPALVAGRRCLAAFVEV